MKSSRIIQAIFTFCLLTIFLLSCAGPVVTEPLEQTTPPPANTEQTEPIDNTGQNKPDPVNNNNTVEVVYFHTSQRCVTCLCFEERITYVIDNYFSDEIGNGKLIYIVADVTDKNNAALVDKYQSYGSQMYINTIIDNDDNIRNINEIWSWKCTNDKPGFDDKIKSLIEQALIEIDN